MSQTITNSDLIRFHPFTVQAGEIARARGVSQADAEAELARANWPLYQDLLARIKPEADLKRRTIRAADFKRTDGEGTMKENFEDAVEELVAQGKSYVEAATAVAKRAPQLYERYVNSLRARGRAS